MSTYSKQFFLGSVPPTGGEHRLPAVPAGHTWVVRNITCWAFGEIALYAFVVPAGGSGELALVTIPISLNPSPTVDTRIVLEAGDVLVLKSSAGSLNACVSGYDLIAT